jgi:uncharacterized damage-inducible protein DinB
MTFIESLQAELEKEAITTRKMLAIVPADKFDWQPHPKSMTLKRLATHVAELPSWIEMVLTTEELDFANNNYVPRVIDSTQDLLDYFNDSLEKARKSLWKAMDADLLPDWTLRNGEQVYSTESKHDVIRMAYSQTIHHRAQLGVFLRLLDVPIPGSYGPSADDPDM